MFTGLVQCLGKVAGINPSDHGVRLAVDAGGWSAPVTLGESIAINGCCLTVAELGGETPPRLCFDVVQQTLDLTTLGRLAVGDGVNLERSVTPTTLMGGHIVQGHIDGVGRVEAVQTDPADWRVTIAPPSHLLRFIIDQGSIAVDGVSLTVARLDRDRFEVALIPTTLEVTTFGGLQPGGSVNLEVDYLVKAVQRLTERS